jgi:hypothetical protein
MAMECAWCDSCGAVFEYDPSLGWWTLCPECEQRVLPISTAMHSGGIERDA